jgi:nuclear protein localization family protein 4
VVKLEVGDDNSGDVHFEAFQMNEVCVKMFKDGVLETEIGDSDDPRMSKMRKEVIAKGKDTMEVDNDFFLVPVKRSQGPLSTGFPIENRGLPSLMNLHCSICLKCNVVVIHSVS